MPTANDRFKRGASRSWWLAGFSAVALHVVFLLTYPGLRVDWSMVPLAKRPLVLHATSLLVPQIEWQRADAQPYLPLDSLAAVPAATNLDHVQAQLPRFWRGDLWRLHQVGGASFQLWIDERGAVVDAVLLDHGFPAQTEALAAIARSLEFEPAMHSGQPVGVVGMIELVIQRQTRQ